MQLHKDKEQLEAAGVKIVGVSYDSVETLKAFSDKNGIEYPLLSDEGSKTIDSYGIRNKAMDGKKFGAKSVEGVPHPGTYLIDKDGVVRAKLFLEAYQERHTTQALVDASNAVTAE